MQNNPSFHPKGWSWQEEHASQTQNSATLAWVHHQQKLKDRNDHLQTLSCTDSVGGYPEDRTFFFQAVK